MKKTILFCFAVCFNVLLSSHVFAQYVNEKYYRYNGSYPDNQSPFWGKGDLFSDLALTNGIAHDDANWYITAQGANRFTGVDDGTWYLWKIPVEQDFLLNGPPDLQIESGQLPIYYNGYSGYYEHAGDLDCFLHDGVYYLAVPFYGGMTHRDSLDVNGDPVYNNFNQIIKIAVEPLPQAIGFFRADNLSFINYAILNANGNTGWCAVHPITGDLYTSDHDTHKFTNYTINWGKLFDMSNTLHDALGDATHHDITTPYPGNLLKNMQGGEFTPTGSLLYVNCGVIPDFNPQDGIHVFETSAWHEVQQSTNQHRPTNSPPGCFDYTFEITYQLFSDGLQEPEGLTIWDMDEVPGHDPNVTGQLHVILYNHDFPDDNSVYLKHYTTLWFDAGPDTTIDGCRQTVQLHGTSTIPGATFSWVASDGGHILSGANTANPIIDSAGTFTLTVPNPLNTCPATSVAHVTIAIPVTCTICNGSTITVNSNVTINFNTDPPSYTGDPALLPYFTYSKVGSIKNLWKAIFDVGPNKLLVKNGATITTTQVDGFAPGIVIRGTCDMEVENGAHIVVFSSNKNAGDILVQINGNVTINGEVRDEVSGTIGLPGSITIDSKCGDINAGQTGLIQDLGTGGGGSTISLLACGTDCNYYGSGNITIAGLVKAFAHAHAGDLTLNRPNIKLVSFNGNVTVNANTVEPLYDEYQNSGTLYDIYGGLLSWVRDNAIPGKTEVQSRLNITVNGHGTDPTGPVRKSFGAIAAIATASDAPGGLVDIRSLQGSIIGNDRAFDVSGRNRLVANPGHILTNFANLKLSSMFNISLYRLGANNNFNPVVNASSPAIGDHGGTNELRSYRGGIIVGANAIVSAAVPAGSGTSQGVNVLTSCTGVTNGGTITPAILPAVTCVPNTLTALYTDCFEIGGGSFRYRDKVETNDLVPEGIKIYPNPTNGKITMQFSSNGADYYSISIFDITGRGMIREKINATKGINVHEIDLSNMAKGMYIVILENANIKEMKRIVLQ